MLGFLLNPSCEELGEGGAASVCGHWDLACSLSSRGPGVSCVQE